MNEHHDAKGRFASATNATLRGTHAAMDALSKVAHEAGRFAKDTSGGRSKNPHDTAHQLYHAADRLGFVDPVGLAEIQSHPLAGPLMNMLGIS